RAGSAGPALCRAANPGWPDQRREAYRPAARSVSMIWRMKLPTGAAGVASLEAMGPVLYLMAARRHAGSTSGGCRPLCRSSGEFGTGPGRVVHRGIAAVEPGLDHQYVPELQRPVRDARAMLAPQFGDGCGLQQSLAFKTPGVEQVIGPVAQRTAQPLVDRYTKALLRPLDQLAGHMPVQHLAQRPLGLAVADLVVRGQAPGEFDEAVVE